jgi:hypothetical protein
MSASLAWSRLDTVEDHLFSALTAAERETLYKLLSRVVDVSVPTGEAAADLPDCPSS